MSTWSRSQWIEDAKKRVLQNTRRTDDYTRELIFLYDEAAVNIEKEIEALFAPLCTQVVPITTAESFDDLEG